MKYLPIACSLFLLACDPVGDAKEACDDSIQGFLDGGFAESVAENAEEQCRKLYQEEFLPAIEKEIAELKKWFEQKLREAEIEVMTRLGCVPDASRASGWDCTGTSICDNLSV